MLILYRNHYWKLLVGSVLASILLIWIAPGSAQTNGNNVGDTKVIARAVLSQPMTIGWRYDSNLTINLTPAFDEERLYLPLAGGIVVSLNADKGQLNWRSEMGGELSASPVADDHGVYGSP